MLLRVHVPVVSRLAAALVAVVLSGAPRVVAIHAPAEGHRCSCRARGGEHHECECAVCRKAALVSQAKDPGAMPCHRAAARQALSERSSSGSRRAPCVEGTCGGPAQPKVLPAGVSPFPLPGSPAALLLADRAEPLRGWADPCPERSAEPETPPPRAA